jgi:hypothetical protein
MRAAHSDAPSISTLRPDLPAPVITCIDGLLARKPELRPGLSQVKKVFANAVNRDVTTETVAIQVKRKKPILWILLILLVFGIGFFIVWKFHQTDQSKPLPLTIQNSEKITVSATRPEVITASQATVISTPQPKVAEVVSAPVFSILRPEIRWVNGKCQVVVSAMPADHALTSVSVIQWSDDGEKWISNEPASICLDPRSGAPLANVMLRLSNNQAGDRTIYLRYLDLHGIPSAVQKYTFLIPPDPLPGEKLGRLKEWDKKEDKIIEYSISGGNKSKTMRVSFKPYLPISKEMIIHWSIDSQTLDLVNEENTLFLKHPDFWPKKETHTIFIRFDLNDYKSSVYSFEIKLGEYKTSLIRIPTP